MMSVLKSKFAYINFISQTNKHKHQKMSILVRIIITKNSIKSKKKLTNKLKASPIEVT